MRGIFLSIIILLFASAALAAEPSAADRVTARKLIDDAYAEYDAGHYTKAAEMFRAANALVHVPTTEFGLAQAEEKLGRLVEAHEALVRLSRLPVKEGESENQRSAREQGDKLRASVAARIPSVRVVVKGARGTPVVAIQEEKLPVEALGVPRQVNPGTWTIEATVGGVTKRSIVKIEERETKDVELVFSPEVAPPPPPVVLRKGEPIEAPRLRGIAPLTIVGIVVGASGVATGALTGILALGAKGDAADRGMLNGDCPPAAQSDCHRANTLATISTIGFLTAAAGGALALVSHVWIAPKKTGVWLSPGGIAGRF